MAVTGEIGLLGDVYGVDVDQNLYVALLLTLITRRHSLIASSDTYNSENEMRIILDTMWGLGARFIRVDQDTSMERFVRSFVEGKDKLQYVYVIVGIESLRGDLQDWLTKVLRKRKLIHDGKSYNEDTVFSVIGLFDEGKIKTCPLKRSLINQLWIQQSHHPEVPQRPRKGVPPTDKLHDILSMSLKVREVTMVPEMRRYAYDIIIFVRNHRCVNTGLPTRIIDELLLLCKAICVIFDRKFVIPTIVKLAARKLIPLHIKLIAPEMEPSLQWGGDISLARELMERVTPEIIVEGVLGKISVPV